MASSPEEMFRVAAGRVFSCWTALQLAVEHGMGGPQSVAKAMGMIDAVVEFLKNKPNADWDEVADFLGDKLDDEFNTICEDNSTDEVGSLLWEFYRHCCSGDRELVEAEIAKLPQGGNWLSKCIDQTPKGNPEDDGSDDSEDEGTPGSAGPSVPSCQDPMNDGGMDNQGVDLEPGWTQVNRRKR